MVEVYFFCELTVIRSGRGRFFSLRFRPRPPSYTQRVTGAHPLPPLLILSSGRGNAVGALARFRRKVQKQKFARHCDFPKFTQDRRNGKKGIAVRTASAGGSPFFNGFLCRGLFPREILRTAAEANSCRGRFPVRGARSCRAGSRHGVAGSFVPRLRCRPAWAEVRTDSRLEVHPHFPAVTSVRPVGGPDGGRG